ncbi:MAG: MlaD family protein [Vicinamibacterales bacterium]|nr:MlaD family protein [Vicinamibacterales bacterium]
MQRNRAAMVGAFVLVGVVVFGLGLFLIGDRRLLFSKHFEVSTEFGKVTGLVIGTPVRLAGLPAGEVLEIQIPARPSARFLVRMRIREDLRSLVRTDSVATILTDGIVGNAFIQIGMGSDEAAMVEPGGLLPGVDPIEFADLIREGRDTFRLVSREFVELTGEVSNVVEGLSETIDVTKAVIADVGVDLKAVTASSGRVVAHVEETVGDVRGIVADVRAGKGTVGHLFTDTAVYDNIARVTREAEQTARTVRETAEITRDAVAEFSGPGGMGPQLTQSIRNTLAGIEEVTFDLAEGTEALKRNVLFRGFFRDRGFFDLDSISREAYQEGLLERNRTAVRVWVDAAVLFSQSADGIETLTDDGRRRLDAVMAQFVQYPRSSPLVVEGYAGPGEEDNAYIVSLDRAQRVRDYVLNRFRRQTTLTGVMPLSRNAVGSPSGDGEWAGVALTIYIPNESPGGSR